MRPKLLIVLFGAAAFLCAMLGVVSEAKASLLDEPVATTITVPAGNASPAPLHANVAPPGSYAARFGAPLCDDRGASAYAAEPRPAPVDAGEVAVGGAPRSADEACQQGTPGLRFEAASDGSPANGDDLNRTQPAARDVAILPSSLEVEAAVMLVAWRPIDAVDGAREGYEPRDNPPPRPIPWRS